VLRASIDGFRNPTAVLRGQTLYQEEPDPEVCAHVVVDNTEPRAPVILRWTDPEEAR
jgi:hypothetical protein